MFFIIFFNKRCQENSCYGKGDYCFFYTLANCQDEGDQKCEENND